MSVIFNAEQIDQGSFEGMMYPGCQETSTATPSAEIQCMQCKLWFRIIMLLSNEEDPSQLLHTNAHTWATPKPVEDTGGNGVIEPPSSQESHTELSAYEEVDDLSDYKRVRLITAETYEGRRLLPGENHSEETSYRYNTCGI